VQGLASWTFRNGGESLRKNRYAMRKIQILMLGCLTAIIGACSTGSATVDKGTRQLSRYSVAYQGPELEAVVRTWQAQRDIAEEWLILVVHLRGTHSSRITEIHRKDISVRTPDGRRLPLISQDEFREVYREIHSRVRRATESSAPLSTYRRDLRLCDRWFLVEPTGGFAQNEIAISTFEECWGPLVFAVPGGVQPGRWRLVIVLVESRADIPFELEVGE
jgi:hypothetical protein